MDNIKKFFIQSMVDNVDQSLDEKNGLYDTKNICNEAKHNENVNSQQHLEPHITSFEDSDKHFLRKIQYLEEENDRLSSIIENKSIITIDSSKSNYNKMPDIANKKILQLTGRVQDLMLELQTIKSYASGDDEKNRSTIELKQLTEKLNFSNKKICNYRNQIMQLKNDLQVTQNALSNEIGDPELMQAVLSGTGSSNSRGRAQQILVLQQKVNELQTKQNNSKNKDIYKTNVSIRQIEKARKAITEQALKDAHSKVSELTRSLEIWKCRSKALDVEITVLRVQIQKLLSKSESDNEVLNKLKAELSSNNNSNNINQFKTNETIKLLQSKIEKAENVIKQQISDLNDRDMKIAQLESKILNYNETTAVKDLCSIDFSDSKDNFLKNLNGFENKQLMELLCIAHDQINEQVKISVEFKNKFLMEKKKLQKFESKVGLFGSSTLSKQRSNIALYHLKHELNPNEKLTELQNKLELTEEECAALRERLDTLIMVNKDNVQMFAKALNDMKQQFIN